MKAEVSHKSRTARTYDLLRDAIVRAEFAPGQKLIIDNLGRELNASTGAVREALSRLTADGLVVAEPQKSFVVAPISRKDLEDLTVVRIEVEATCLELAIAHGDLDWEGSVLSAQHKLRALGDAYMRPGTPEALQWHDLHQKFHDEITAACPNDWWLRLRRQLYMQSERYRRLSGPIERGARDIVAEHDAIANAALARDKVAARRAIRDHLLRTTTIILDSRLLFAEADGQAVGAGT